MPETTNAKLARELRQARAARRVTARQLDEVTTKLEQAGEYERLGLLAAGSLNDQRAHVTEPMTYRRGGEHSFFFDIARATRRSDPQAKARIQQHEKEMAVELPRRAEARARAAQAAYEERFYSTPADRQAVDAFIAVGGTPFERRAISRTDGVGGFFAPPVYLVDQYVQFAREASPFAALWNSMPLPSGTSEINVPRLAVASGTGPQQDGPPGAPSRDISDTLVTATVRTIAGIADASLQWLEQGQGSGGFGVDDMIFADLTADLAQNTDGQLLLGSGTGSQLLGVWPAGAITAANGIVQANTNNAASQSWTVASAGASLHVQLAQLVSLVSRIRVRPPQYWIWHPWVWALYTAQVDSQGRPLVNAPDCARMPPGVAGYYQNLPVVTDANIPTTFGGTVTSPPQAPYMGSLTQGQYAAIPGTGASALYTPLLAARTSDLFLFAGDLRLQVLREVLSGTGQVRFMAHQYLAAMPNRYVAAAAVGSSVSAGGDVAHGTLTWQVSNSLLQLASSGY